MGNFFSIDQKISWWYNVAEIPPAAFQVSILSQILVLYSIVRGKIALLSLNNYTSPRGFSSTRNSMDKRDTLSVWVEKKKKKQ